MKGCSMEKFRDLYGNHWIICQPNRGKDCVYMNIGLKRTLGKYFVYDMMGSSILRLQSEYASPLLLGLP